MKERVSYLKSIYTNTAALRMLRFLPAFGIGGIVNIELRKFFNDLDRIHWLNKDIRWKEVDKKLFKLLLKMIKIK